MLAISKRPLYRIKHSICFGVRAWVSIMLAVLVSYSAQGAEMYRLSQMRFASPLEASEALVKAVRDGQTDKIISILGPQGRRLVLSGDAVEDRRGRHVFVEGYDQYRRIDIVTLDRATLITGKAEWPFPIPIVQEQDRWRFDTESGVREILDRRIGRNELSVLEVCRAFVSAQNEYADRDRAGNGRHEFARRFVSSRGKKDGLYWPTQAGEEASPLGSLVANAQAEGYTAKGGQRAPYHGYYFKILTRQGKSAPGGVMDYIVDGHMTRGFALLAYPAKYGDSGVMTFIVWKNGSVYQKDLGAMTQILTRGISEFDPGEGWNPVELPK